MLKMTEIELEKTNDSDKYIFIEKEMRGGISCINKRYNKANNEYCSDYDMQWVNIYHILVLNGSMI